jgi:hypothetical protein
LRENRLRKNRLRLRLRLSEVPAGRAGDLQRGESRRIERGICSAASPDGSSEGEGEVEKVKVKKQYNYRNDTN